MDFGPQALRRAVSAENHCGYTGAWSPFGPQALRRAVSAVGLHLAYYEKATGNKQPGQRRILERYERLARAPSGKVRAAVAKEAKALDAAGEFDPDDVKDARRWVLASIARRQGQPEFRKQLLALYGGRCAVTGSRVEAVLEAAHIIGYKGPETNRPQNGLLLR